jgi:hypothetical protein
MSWLLTGICHSCYMEENDIKVMSINPATLCQTHSVEWANEKMAGER